jgi:hypothetical protein
MSDDIATPEINIGANASANYQIASDALGPPGSTLLYEHVSQALQRSLNFMISEMKKKHYHLLKRRTLALQLCHCIDTKALPRNLMGKLAPQNFPTTIDEGTVARFYHTEQSAWISFKSTLLRNRSELIFSDLDSLERTFAMYADTEYLKDRFIKLAPAIRPHTIVIHGLILSLSVTLTELMSRPISSKKRPRTCVSKIGERLSNCV